MKPNTLRDISENFNDDKLDFTAFQMKDSFNNLKKAITSKLSKVLLLNSSEIDPGRPLTELGMDSILEVEFVSELNEEFKTEIDVSELYDYPSVNKLTSYIQEIIARPEQKDVGAIDKAPERNDAITPEAKPPLKPDTENDVKKIIKLKLSKVLALNFSEIDSNKALSELGMDSVLGEEFVNELNNEFKTEINVNQLYDYQTVNELTPYIQETIANLGVKKQGLLLPNEKTASSSIGHIEKENSKAYSSRTYNEKKEGDDIAIVGVSGCYPLSRNLEEFWANLKEGKNCITEIPKSRWDYTSYYDSEKNCGKWGGFIDNIDKFDASFFNISPREAVFIDPETRLLLQTVWNTIEDAGYTRNDFNNEKVGVFTACIYQQYPLLFDDQLGQALSISSYWSIANRISHFFNCKGPSMAVDTACSSSITALHLACESIRSKASDMAIVGGVNLTLHQSKYLAMMQMGMLEKGNKSKCMGDGTGFIPSEGVGAVLLRPLSSAIENKDQIYGVVKGTLINHSGNSKQYMVADSSDQADLVTNVLSRSEIDPRTISYVETSTTGTPGGDKTEIEGLIKVFQGYRNGHKYCSLGAVKSVIGHTEAVSGISQLTKVLLQMKHKLIVPTINADPPNPNIDLTESPFYIKKTVAEWEKPKLLEADTVKEYPRRALINCFGGGCSYSTAVIEEYENPKNCVPHLGGDQIIVLSAKNRKRLRAYAELFSQFLSKNSKQNVSINTGNTSENSGATSPETDDQILLQDMAYTLQSGREPMNERLAIITSNIKELEEKLIQFCRNGDNKSEYLSSDNKLFAGQLKENPGAHHPNATDYSNKKTIASAIHNKDLEKIAQLWVSGENILWKDLHTNTNSKKISLPTYPFEQKRYWSDTHSTLKSA